ncbi:DEAD/DEAH box helicase [Bacteriovoracaceae bacterium]|nr:DEAD/DEAH box helicase [Bacteriovoracaceae bacterium]
MSDFNYLKLLPQILAKITSKGYHTPTPIQAKSIPVLLKGHDLLGIAQTGTGKTASFSLPIIDRLVRKPLLVEPNHIRALVLAPTRELATQIHKNILFYSEGMSLKSAIIIGGVRKTTQMETMKDGMDIVVCTPGRLMDLMSGGHIKFEQLEVFVLDEADMMLDFGFLDDVKLIAKKLPEKRQNIMFSATMPKVIEKLAKSLLENPIKIQAAKESSTIGTVEQVVYFVEEENKLALVASLLEDVSATRVMIFCKAKYGIADVVDQLNKCEISNCEIHSNRTQTERDQAISDFSAGKVRVLVATDIAARGIDVLDVTHVINFNLPDDSTYYVHRIGRTARAGKTGKAISLCGERDLALLRNVQRRIKMDIPIITDQPFHKEFKPLDPKKKRSTSSARLRERKRPSTAKIAAKNKFLEKL